MTIQELTSTPFAIRPESSFSLRSSPIIGGAPRLNPDTRLRRPDLFIADINRGPQARNYRHFLRWRLRFCRRLCGSLGCKGHCQQPARRFVRRFIINQLRKGNSIPPDITRLAVRTLTFRERVRFVELEITRPHRFGRNFFGSFEDSLRSAENLNLIRDRNLLRVEVQHLRSERKELLLAMRELREAIADAEMKLLALEDSQRDYFDFNRPILYAIPPVGRPTPLRELPPEVGLKIQIIIQQRAAGIHGNMVDVLA